MERYEELERLKELKENGILTEKEFNTEKQRILNNNSKIKIKKSKFKIFFILTIIFAVLTIISVCLYNHFSDVAVDALWGENGYYGYFLAELQYEDNLISRDEYKEIEKEYENITNVWAFFEYARYVAGIATVIFLTTGIILKIKEKNKNC